ncbi:unnamed protein product, partial [Chrysoparadoxa australica]
MGPSNKESSYGSTSPVVGPTKMSWSTYAKMKKRARPGQQAKRFRTDSLDIFQSMSPSAQQDLFIGEDGLPEPRTTLLWRKLQIPLVVLLIGCMAAFAGWLLQFCLQHLFYVRWSFVALRHDYWWVYPGYALTTFTMAILSCIITEFCCPVATGGGVPEIKSILSGAIRGKLLSLRLIVVKFVGLVLAGSAGLSVGKEGPLIHISCAATDCVLRLPWFLNVRTNTGVRLELLACGCAAGVAACFGSAFGATLFSVEVTAFCYMVGGLPRAFLTAVVVVLIYWFTGFSTKLSLYSEPTPQAPAWAAIDLLLWVCLGLICGLLSALFVKLVSALMRWRNSFMRTSLGPMLQRKRRFLLVAACGAVVIPLSFLELVYYDRVTNIASNPHALVDHMFTPMLFGLSWHLCLYVPLKFLSTVLSIIQPLPVGLFSPIFLLGGAFGRLFGEVAAFFELEHGTQVWEFALIGSAALSGGITKTVSTAAVVFEMSGQSHLVLPLGLVLLISYYVSSLFGRGVYESLIDTNGQPYLPALPVECYNVEVGQIMRPIADMAWIGLECTMEQAEEALSRGNGQPYIPVIQTPEDMILVGAVLSQDVMAAVEEVHARPLGDKGMTPGDTKVLYVLIERSQNWLAEANSDRGVLTTDSPGLQPRICLPLDSSPLSFSVCTPLARLDYVFKNLKFSSCLICHQGKLVGCISRDIYQVHVA